MSNDKKLFYIIKENWPLSLSLPPHTVGPLGKKAFCLLAAATEPFASVPSDKLTAQELGPPNFDFPKKAFRFRYLVTAGSPVSEIVLTILFLISSHVTMKIMKKIEASCHKRFLMAHSLL